MNAGARHTAAAYKAAMRPPAQRSLMLIIDGPPVPKMRARAGRGGHHYTPDKTRRYEELIAQRAMLQRPRGWPLDAEYRVSLLVVFPDRRTRDADNVLKSVLDASNKILWKDDDQVAGGTWTRTYDANAPRIEMFIEVLP